jgi:alpha-ketoglutarate-dependent taurine dioxygenase
VSILDSISVADPEQLRRAAERLGERHSVAEIADLNRAGVRNLLASAHPEIIDLLDSALGELRRDGMALLASMPTTSDEMLALMCQYVGELEAVGERPVSYVEHITPSTVVDIDRRPHSQRRTALMPHTDQSARGNPPDYLVLACVANDADAGGESVLVPVEPIATHLSSADPDCYRLLQDPVFPIFNVPRRDFAVTAPLLRLREPDRSDEPPGRHHQLRFRDEAIRAGLEVMNRPGDGHVAAFETFSSEIHAERRWLVHRLVPGDVLFVDNKRVLHGRKAITGDAERDLIRLTGRYWPVMVGAGA